MEMEKPRPIGFSREKARRVLERYDIDVLVASGPANVFYATGMPTLHVAPNPILYVLSNQFPTVALIRRDGEESVVTWLVYQSTKRWTWVDDVVGTLSAKMTMEAVCDKLAEWGASDKTIGVESLMPRYQSACIQERFPRARIVDADQAFLDMRLVKTEEEIRRIQASTGVAEKAIMAVIEAAREGITDNELLAVARRTIIDGGAEGWDHLTMGLGSSDPEAPGLGYTVRPGEVNRIDIGAVYKGYVSDVSRHFVVGEPPEGADSHIEMLIRIQEFLESAVKPGVNAAALYKEAQRFSKTFSRHGIYITAHSIGIECEEAHLFSPMRCLDIAFEENMVLDIEVWKTFEEFNLVGVEDCYRVTATGLERISTLDKRLYVR